jgi:hypothetical protein
VAERARVYVLGAGCSYHEQHGYPLAKQFIPALDAYATKIAGDPDCQRIVGAVDSTLKLLAACQSGARHVFTTDQLINLVLGGGCDEVLQAIKAPLAWDKISLRNDAVRQAKIATAACFLEKEVEVRQHQMGRYREFIQSEVFGGTGVSDSCHAKLRKSSARILSFNYDRIFELAFFAGFADAYIGQYSAYSAEVLNSGLQYTGELVDIAPDRFCFLKLHGSVGLTCQENAFGRDIHEVFDVSKWKDEKITDAMLCPLATAGAFPAEPLIVFPYEKDFILSGKNNSLPFRAYIDNVWAAATQVLQGAAEIWVIGYSFDPTDSKYLLDRIRQAEGCERIVIQNTAPECDRIEELLRVKHRLDFRIDKYTVPF